MDKNSETEIIDSWGKNVDPWIKAIEDGEIESRILVTNQAIKDVIFRLAPRKVLDIGCGEGWLVREMTHKCIDTLGVDVIMDFVEAANKSGIGRFRTLSYQDLSYDVLLETFDVLVCNFSLFGDKSVLTVFDSAEMLLTNGGSFVIQTLHPVHALQGEPACDGWRQGSWAGFSHTFRDPAPWYYRTLESWRNLFRRFGFDLIEEIEPINPKTGKPASIIFVGKKVS